MAKRRKKKVAVVHCSGGSPLKAGIDRDGLAKDCAEILKAYPDGIADCAYGCLGGGSCVAACKLKAVSLGEDHVARIDREKCVGCGLCVKACPQHLIRLVVPENTIAPQCSNRDAGPAARKQCPNSCIACGICVKNCPAGAMSIEDNHAVINQNRCIACGMCAVKCPRGVIVDADGICTVARA